MNKTAIKNYATWARRELIRQVSQKSYEYGISEDNIAEVNNGVLGDRVLTKQEQTQRTELVRQIKNKGYTQVMEEVAYTWFNRFIALRFMEVNGYLPSQVRVFSNENNEFNPQIIKDALDVDIDGLNKDTVVSLIEKQQTEDLFKYLIITQCNALGTCLPRMFETIENYTELLFPDNLLKEDSVIGHMIKDIDEDDWKDQVQIIGWLYQYYNAEYKDETFALLKKNVKITKERIPSATQLFTPDWIVRYMVENSLGRIWIEGHPNDSLKSNWKYYLDEAEQEAEVEAELAKIREEHSHLKPEDIKVIDPCMGSGHILVYAFDVLVQIYESAGWTTRDAALSIVENNLYGIDIDDRAAQLAYFAVMMKARSYDRRFLTRNAKDNLISIQESNGIDLIPEKLGQMTLDDVVRKDLNYVIEVFKDAKEYGSILKIENRDYDRALEYISELAERGADDIIMQSYINTLTEDIPRFIKQAKMLSQKYEVVVTNPPYMGASGMSGMLSEYVKKNYPDSKSDLFAVFIEQCSHMTDTSAYQAMITQHTWMFIGTFESLRTSLYRKTFCSLVQLGIKAFEEIGNDVVQTCSFVISNRRIKEYQSTFIRLVDCKDYLKKKECYFDKKLRYVNSVDKFLSIPGHPFAYWVGNAFIDNFEKGKRIENYGVFTGSQNITGDNEKFLRCCWEVNSNHINQKWIYYAKGGDYRQYYGNLNLVIDWSLQARNFYKTNKTSNLLNEEYWFKKGITYSAVTSRGTGFRYLPEGCIFDKGGPSIQISSSIFELLALLNSNVAKYYFWVFNSSINLQVKDVKNMPIIFTDKYEISEIASVNTDICKSDWDNFETSLDFKKHPLI